MDQQTSEISWASIIPLIGGFSLGAQESLGSYPNYIASYECFKNNDKHILNHWKEHSIPYYLENDHGEIKPVDLVVMVPPCSALSNLNPQSSDKYKSIEWLYKSSVLAMEKCQAKVIIGENAPGLFTKKGKNVANQLHDIAIEHGYSLSIIKVDTFQCGVPQHRIRSFYVFWKSPTSFIIEKPSKTLITNIGTYLNNAKLNDFHHNEKHEEERLKKTSQYQFIKNHLNMELSEFLNGDVFVYALIKSKKLDEYEYFLEKENFVRDLKFIQHVKNKIDDGHGYWDSQSLFDTKTRGYINALTIKVFYCLLHPEKERFLTNAELISLMGLPHNFEISTNDLIHITQNVTTQSSKFIVDQCSKFFRNELESSRDSINYQNLTSEKSYLNDKVNLDLFF